MVDISSRQMARFREVSKRTPLAADNFRPTQPLNGRKVFEIKTVDDENVDSGADVTQVSAVAAAALMSVALAMKGLAAWKKKTDARHVPVKKKKDVIVKEKKC